MYSMTKLRWTIARILKRFGIVNSICIENGEEITMKWTPLDKIKFWWEN